MKSTTVISSPNNFLVEPYSPGLTIDFREPASTTDLEQLRQEFDFDALNSIDSDEDFIREAGRILVLLGIADEEADFSVSLQSFTGLKGLDEQLSACLQRLNVQENPASRAEALKLLFYYTGCLRRNTHHSVRLYCHVPGSRIELERDATHFCYVLNGDCTAEEHNRSIPLATNTFFSIAGSATIHGSGQCLILTHFGYKGITQYGGEVEEWGRLKYIDGCTDTLLIPPLKRGAPCLNALYFPPGIQQTQHSHPSIRCGVVIAGRGVCKTPFADYPLETGSIFFLPPETHHSFHTEGGNGSARSALTVLAFHPDSDFGPTDTDHPMINRTYFKFLHRIKSSERELSTTEIMC